MKIQYASDLHLEFGMNSRYTQVYGLEPKGDILLLAGDVSFLGRKRFDDHPFFGWCADHFEQTVIVPGNHEYYKDPVARENRRYGVPLDRTLTDFEYSIRPNVRYLNNRSLAVGDVEVFATTLWTVTDPVNYVAIQNGMSDCQQIIYENHILWADDYVKVHSVCRDWLGQALDKSEAKHKIVLSHHCPATARAFNTRQTGNLLLSAFQVDMAPFIAEHDIEYWIYGHTHTQNGSGTVFPSKGQGTTLLCNQLGYVELNEDKDFDSKTLICL